MPFVNKDQILDKIGKGIAEIIPNVSFMLWQKEDFRKWWISTIYLRQSKTEYSMK